MVGEKVYYRDVREHRQKRAHLGESRVVLSLSHVRREGRGRERGE